MLAYIPYMDPMGNYNIVFPEQMLQGTVEGAPENHQ
jgi:hypothetical protein